MSANAQQQGNALPIISGNLPRNTVGGLPSFRTDIPIQHSNTFGHLRMADAMSNAVMNEDPSRSLVSQPAPDTPLTTSAGQTRPLSPNDRNPVTTLPLRNPHIHNGHWHHPPLPLPQYYRPHQRTQSSASDISNSSEATSTSSGQSDMTTHMDSASNTKPAPVPAAAAAPVATRKEDDGDCSICWEPFEKETNELVWCKLTCGNNFHKKCFVEWLLTPKHQRTSGELKCPFCRGTWCPIELRTLQIDNGIVPARPTKRPRQDYVSARSPNRDHMRRIYRERREQATRARDHHSSMPRPMGDSYRPTYGPRMSGTPPTAYYAPPMSPGNNHPFPAHSMSMRSPSGAAHTPQQPSGSSLRPTYNRMDYPMNFPLPSIHYPHQQPMQPQFTGNHYAPFPIQQPQVMNAMTPTPHLNQSHDLTAPGYNVPTFSANSYLPAMQLPPQQRPVHGLTQRPMTRCPAMQTQRISPVSPPQSNMGLPTTPNFCPGMVPAGVEVQYNHHFQYSAYYHFAGPHS